MHIDGVAGRRLGRATVAWPSCAASPNVRLMKRTQVFGVYDGGTYGARGADRRPFARSPAPHRPRQRMWKIIARHAVLCAGAVERQLVFGGNDTPGVMLASAVRTYLNRLCRGALGARARGVHHHR